MRDTMCVGLVTECMIWLAFGCSVERIGQRTISQPLCSKLQDFLNLLKALS